MPASSYGIIVEGGSDSSVYDAIIRKVASHEVRIIAQPCYGKANLMKLFPGFLEAFKYELSGAQVDMAIVIADADGQDPLKLEEKMKAKVAGRQYPFGVHFYAVQHAMEAWLLADVSAISKMIQSRTGKTLKKTHPAPQELLDPKPTLRQLLSEKRVDYTPAVGAEIAREIDLEVLSLKCPRFRIFAELVDC